MTGCKHYLWVLLLPGLLVCRAHRISAQVPHPVVSGATVAVLPFRVACATEEPDSHELALRLGPAAGPPSVEAATYFETAAEALRTRLFARLKALGIAALAPRDTDPKLASLPEATSRRWATLPGSTYRDLLGADAVAMGTLRALVPHQTGVIESMRVDAVFAIVDAHSGDTLWRVHVNDPFLRTGGESNPFALTGDPLQRHVQALAEDVIESIENSIPQVGVSHDRLLFGPQIGTIIVSSFPRMGPSAGAPPTIQFSLRATPRCIATVDLIDAETRQPYKRNIPLEEPVPGSYSGEYVVHPGDPRGVEFQIVGRVTTQSGLTVEKRGLTRFSLGDKNELTEETQATLAPDAVVALPRTAALLPFSGDAIGARAVDAALYPLLARHSALRLVNPMTLAAGLSMNGIDGTRLTEEDVPRLHEWFGCETVLFGAVSGWPQPDVPPGPVRATLRMVDAKTGAALATAEVRVPASGSVATTLAERLTQLLTNPAALNLNFPQPEIGNATHGLQAGEGIEPRGTLKVAFKGTPGAAGFFHLGDPAASWPMTESAPGVYVGLMTLPNLLEPKVAQVTVVLNIAGGGVARKTLDTPVILGASAGPAEPYEVLTKLGNGN